jgi:O-antigen ligase
MIDRSWAIQTHEFSIEGRKIYAFLVGLASSFRIFSLCADHFAFAYLLIAGLIGFAVLRELGEKTAVPTVLGVTLLLGTLAATFCRTAWACAVLIPALYWALRYGPSLRGRSLLAGLLAGYFLASILTSVLYEKYHIEEQMATESVFARRALRTGTLSARQGAWEAFEEGAQRFWLLGRGAGADPYVLAKAAGDLGAYLSDFDASHNCLVYLMALAGLPGVIVFLLWFWRLLDAGMQNVKQASGGERRALCWLAAAVGALFLAGTTGGVTFFTGFFWAWCGILERSAPNGNRTGHQEQLPSCGEQKCD